MISHVAVFQSLEDNFKDKKEVEESEEYCEDILKTPRSLKGGNSTKCVQMSELRISSGVISPQPDSS